MTHGSLPKIYEEAGRALHKAQLVEYNLISLMILFSKIEVSKEKEKEPEYWTKRQLGHLLKPVIDSEIVPNDAKAFLQTLINARNHLAHNFLIELNIEDCDQAEMALKELKRMQEVFDDGNNLINDIMKNVSLREFNLDLDSIEKEATQIIKSGI